MLPQKIRTLVGRFPICTALKSISSSLYGGYYDRYMAASQTSDAQAPKIISRNPWPSDQILIATSHSILPLPVRHYHFRHAVHYHSLMASETMEMKNDEEDKELLHSQAHIWNHIFQFINSMSLKSAIQLDIPDIVKNHGRPMPLSELVAALPINPSKSDCVYRLMRILVHSGFFTQEKISEATEEEGYLLTPASRLLLKNEPLSVRPFLLAMLDPMLTSPWHHFAGWIQTDDPTPFVTAHGRTFWEYVGGDPRLFNEGMASDSRLVASLMVNKDGKGVFEGCKSLVDVGGGTGTVAKAVADAFPEMECTVLELPHVVAKSRGGGNLKFVEGDMLKSIPSADAVFLKWILHDWSDEECVKILKNCKEAIPSKGGKVIIIDVKVEDSKEGGEHKAVETQLFWDMLMMLVVMGRERTEKEWAKLFVDAGFSDYKITPMGLRSLIEVYP